jgi:hypothetical protein
MDNGGPFSQYDRLAYQNQQLPNSNLDTIDWWLNKHELEELENSLQHAFDDHESKSYNNVSDYIFAPDGCQPATTGIDSNQRCILAGGITPNLPLLSNPVQQYSNRDMVVGVNDGVKINNYSPSILLELSHYEEETTASSSMQSTTASITSAPGLNAIINQKLPLIPVYRCNKPKCWKWFDKKVDWL